MHVTRDSYRRDFFFFWLSAYDVRCGQVCNQSQSSSQLTIAAIAVAAATVAAKYETTIPCAFLFGDDNKFEDYRLGTMTSDKRHRRSHNGSKYKYDTVGCSCSCHTNKVHEY